MSNDRMTRWMGPIGLVIIVALVVGFGVLSGNQPGENASGQAVVAWMNSHATERWFQIYVIVFGLTLLLLFAAQLSRILEATAGKVWSMMEFAAAIILIAALLAVGGVNATVQIIAGRNHDYAIAHFTNFVGQNNEIVILYGLALLTLSTGIAILSGSGLPRWLGVVSVVIGVVCVLGPISFVGALAALLWFPVLGFVLGSKAKAAEAPAERAPDPVGAA